MIEPVPLTSGDGMAALHAQCFWNGWSEESVASMMATPNTHALGLQDAADGLIGMIVWRSMADEAEILTLAVHPQHQRRGHARRLLVAAHALWTQHKLTRVMLEVAAHNTAAAALYVACGWRETGLRRAYYRQPDGTRADARLFEWQPLTA